MEQIPEWDANSKVEEQELEAGTACALIESSNLRLIQRAAERPN
jgi:hypothetical protein